MLQPLESALAINESASQPDVLQMYTSLLRHWATLLQADDSIPGFASSSISKLVLHANSLTLQLIQTFPSIGTASAVLDFHEQCVRLVTAEKLCDYIRIELPHKLLIYIFFFSDSVATVSRICSVLASLKRGFEKAMSTRRDGSGKIDSATYDRAYVNLYNGFLMDICNCLWRTQAFSDKDAPAQRCLVPRATIASLTSYVPSVDKSFSLPMIFGLSHSPALCLQSILRVRTAEDEAMASGITIRIRHAGPVTQPSLTRLSTGGGLRLSWSEYRIGVLDALTRDGLPGIAELLKNTMTKLKSSMEGRASVDQSATRVTIE